MAFHFNIFLLQRDIISRNAINLTPWVSDVISCGCEGEQEMQGEEKNENKIKYIFSLFHSSYSSPRLKKSYLCYIGYQLLKGLPT